MKTVQAIFLGDGKLECRAPFDKGLLARSYRLGQVVKLRVTNPRSHRQLGYFHAVLKEVFDNLPEASEHNFRTTDHLKAWTIYKTGHVIVHTIPRDGVSRELLLAMRTISMKHLFFEVLGNTIWVFEPNSIAFENMDQSEFNEFFKEAKALWCELIPGLRMEDLEARVKEQWNGD